MGVDTFLHSRQHTVYAVSILRLENALIPYKVK